MKNEPRTAEAPTENGIVGYSFEAFVEAATRFHGHPAPGLLLGAYMVSAAKRGLQRGTVFDALCETPWCLPDAVQMLTPCTIGNGWLLILDLGRFALSLYDKYTGRGIRVFLDATKTTDWPELHDWFLKRKPKHEQRSDRIRSCIQVFGPRMLTLEAVQVVPEVLLKRSKGAIGLCSCCGEAYPVLHGERCRACQGSSPYRAEGKHKT